MVPLLDWAVLSAEAADSEVADAPASSPDRAVVLRLKELVFAVAVKDIVGVRRLRLVDGELERPHERGPDALGSRFSSVLRWQQEGSDPMPRSAGAASGELPVETEVRVVSAMGLLAHRSIAGFANPGLIESLFVLDSHDAASSGDASPPGAES